VTSLPAPPRLLRRLVAWLRAPAAPRAESAACESCPLAACVPGTRATVLCVLCHALDVQRLRSLGVFEGALVRVVDARGGVVLDVRGSRLALGHAVVSGITVRPEQS
jgi:Fe2+ transport system protein FeoA